MPVFKILASLRPFVVFVFHSPAIPLPNAITPIKNYDRAMVPSGREPLKIKIQRPQKPPIPIISKNVRKETSQLNWWQRFKKSSAHTQANIVCTFLVMVATVAYAIIAKRQLSKMNEQIGAMNNAFVEMQKQTKAAQDSATAAQNAVQANQGQMRLEERAWLKFSDESPTTSLKGQPIDVPIQLTNIGKTPAMHLWWAIYVDLVPMGKEPDLPASHIVPKDALYKLDRTDTRQVRYLSQEFEKAILYPTDHDDAIATRLETVHENGVDHVQPKPFLSPEWDDYAGGKSYIVVFGEVWYFDVFGVTHWTSFCVSKRVGVGNTSRKCANYGKVDNNTE